MQVFHAGELTLDGEWRGAPTTLIALGTHWLLNARVRWRDCARTQGMNFVAVASAHRGCFADAGMAELAARLGPPAPGERRILLGHSLAGYAALRHAADFGAAMVLTTSATFTLDPALMPEDPRLPNMLARHGDASMLGASAADGLLPAGILAVNVYDPRDRYERLHGVRVAAIPGVTPLGLPFLGHHTVSTLDGGPATIAALAAMLAGDLPALRRALLGERKRRLAYLTTLALTCAASGHTSWARGLLARVERRGITTASNQFNAYIRAHELLGEHAQALALARRAMRASHPRPYPFVLAARLLRAADEGEEAAACLCAGLSLFPGNRELHALADVLPAMAGAGGELVLAG